jgi:hypothetical protein
MDLVIITSVIFVLLVFFAIASVKKYVKTGESHFALFSGAYIAWALTGLFGVLILTIGYSDYLLDSFLLPILLFRLSSTFGIIAYFLISVFVINTCYQLKSKTKFFHPVLLLISVIIIIIIWTQTPVILETSGGIEFYFTSGYKEPLGFQLTELLLGAFLVPSFGTSWIFILNSMSKQIKNRVQVLLFGTGFLISTISYSIELTGAVEGAVTIYRAFILIGLSCMFVSQVVMNNR